MSGRVLRVLTVESLGEGVDISSRLWQLLRDHPRGLTSEEARTALGIENFPYSTSSRLLRLGWIEREGNGRKESPYVMKATEPEHDHKEKAPIGVKLAKARKDINGVVEDLRKARYTAIATSMSKAISKAEVDMKKIVNALYVGESGRSK